MGRAGPPKPCFCLLLLAPPFLRRYDLRKSIKLLPRGRLLVGLQGRGGPSHISLRTTGHSGSKTFGAERDLNSIYVSTLSIHK